MRYVHVGNLATKTNDGAVNFQSSNTMSCKKKTKSNLRE